MPHKVSKIVLNFQTKIISHTHTKHAQAYAVLLCVSQIFVANCFVDIEIAYLQGNMTSRKCGGEREI